MKKLVCSVLAVILACSMAAASASVPANHRHQYTIPRAGGTSWHYLYCGCYGCHARIRVDCDYVWTVRRKTLNGKKLTVYKKRCTVCGAVTTTTR